MPRRSIGPASASGGRIILLALISMLALDATAEEEILNNLIVTASRAPVARPDVGSAVSVIQRETLTDRQSVFATDVLQDVPGLSVNRTSSFGSQTQVRIRGAEANQVLVLIDGVEANDPAGNDEFDFASLTAYDIERIEVVRGPQSALWGSDAAAGVINITTRQSDAPFETGGFLEGGSFGTWYGGGRVSASTGTAGVDLSASYLETDGISAAADGSEDDGYENTTVTLNSRWRPSQSTRLGFAVRYVDSISDIDDFDFATGLPTDADRESEDTFLLMQANGGVRLLDERWDNSLRLTYLDSDREQIIGGVSDSTASAEKIGIYYQSTYSLGDTQDAQAPRIVLAIDHEQEDFEQRGTASFFGDPNQDQDFDNTGYVGEYLANPVEGLSLSAAIRYDDHSDFDSITTYRITSAWNIDNSATRLHASYGTGHKSPTFTERYGFFADQFVGNPDLKPEESTGFDVGIDQGFFNDRMRVDLTYFTEKLEDEINGFVFDPVLGVFTADNLDGKSRRKGLEFAFQARLAEELDLAATYTYVDSEQPDPAGGKQREVRRPRNMASLNLNYRMLDERGKVNFNMTYNGDQTDQFFPPPDFTGQTVELDSYVLANLAASYAVTPQLSLIGRIENLGDEDYTNVLGFGTPGRGVYAGFRVNFRR